jgi:S-adenosylmethionine:tRNA ribosyltransferase-isomerase
LRIEEYDYHLPPELIAQEPIEPRDHSRLLIVDKENKRIEHRSFYHILEYLKPRDVLVLNDTKVIPARLYGKKKTGAKVEILLLKRLDPFRWEAMVKPGRRLPPQTPVVLENGNVQITVGDPLSQNTREVALDSGNWEEVLNQLGRMPLPPYIHTELKDQQRYQTVYGSHPGSAAAPTAGLHFTAELLEKVRKMGVEVVFLTLHVGIGTFQPIKVDRIEEHKMHFEWYEVSRESADTINQTKKSGGKVWAVGTTSCRTLETVTGEDGTVHFGSGETNLFIYPGYLFKAVDVLVTNFHLPRSSLLLLVSAFMGKDLMESAYQEAIDSEYRFFSFGDAMLIL